MALPTQNESGVLALVPRNDSGAQAASPRPSRGNAAFTRGPFRDDDRIAPPGHGGEGGPRRRASMAGKGGGEMYVPAHFAADDPAVRDLLHRHGAADLVPVTAAGLVATMLPFIYVPADEAGRNGASGNGAGRNGASRSGSLHGHLARN